MHCYKDRQVHVFGPGDDVPEWAVEQIRRPDVWEVPPVAAAGETSFGSPLPPGGEPKPADGPPPQGGTGATRQRWAEYATSKGIDVEADWKREDIIAACELAGVPV